MGIDEKLDQLIEIIKESETKKQEKKFRLPFTKKVNNRQRRNNFITVMKIHENNAVDFSKVQIDDQTIMENGIPRLAASQYVMYWKKNPIIILPSWSVRPFSPAEQYEKSLVDGSNTKGYKLILNRLEMEATVNKKKIGNPIMIIIGLGLAAIIGYAFISGGGG